MSEVSRYRNVAMIPTRLAVSKIPIAPGAAPVGSVRVSEPRNVPSRADRQAGTISRVHPSCVRDIRRGWIGHLLSDGARGATLAIVAAACSPSAKHPPLEGDCFPTSEAGCSITVSAGGENGTREGGIAGACQVTSSQSQCDQCVYGSCCDDILLCFSTTTYTVCTIAAKDVMAPHRVSDCAKLNTPRHRYSLRS